MNRTFGAALVGVAFGAGTSLVNALSSPYSRLGAPLDGTLWGGAAKVLSLLVDSGWAWAALAVGVGWLVGGLVRAGLAGVAALMAATAAYYAMDALLRDEPLSWFWQETVLWWGAGVVFGSALGVVGASIRRPGVIGLLAGLSVPVGAAAQMVVLPPGPSLAVTSATVWAQALVWAGALLGAALVIARFVTRRRTPAA
ncbi:hypothetical protein AB0B45_44320 [Nonomuraea sp. NPDC049152]|uniref:hypothetical protein n=1 Tax=Nonomuraea sp. NPDC049152 TaxID=3154350 RepID=UPI0034016658